jgi:hypothetical protein
MAKHRRSSDPRTPRRPGSRAAVIRGSALAVTVALCVTGSVRLFASASTMAGGAHAASLHGARHAELAPPATVRHVSGNSVTAIGDSIMVASTPALQSALPGIYINAEVGRQFGTGLAVIADLKAKGLLRPIVVVGLGTNGPVTAGQISQLFAEIGPDRKAVLVNTFENRPWEHEVNSMLATAVKERPAVVLADWYTTIEHHTGLLWPDGIHPQPAGGVVYAKMLKAALGRLVKLRS